MTILKTLKRLAVFGLIAFGATTAMAKPGCVGKMWNPLTDLDYSLMGGIKIAGFELMKSPENLGTPPKLAPKAVCFCKDGLSTGYGLGMSFWMPSYINDVARQAGCMGFLGGTNVLPGFISQSSGQEYNMHAAGKEGVTNMQVHWAYADVAALAGKSLFERCGSVNSELSIAYMTEPDFVFQNDVYSVVMTPQASILAAAPLLAQMTCGFESMANTLGSWQDWGVCAWKGSRMPLSGNSQSKDSAQVTNMDVTVKYLTRSALLGATLRTMGQDVTCKPKYSPFYDPFQHRYQWSFPNKVSTRYNVDVVRWGLFVKDPSTSTMANLSSQTSQLGNVDATKAGQSGSGTNPAAALSLAESVVKALPKPLNYPTKEAGFMQVWEARQCCMMVLTIESIAKMYVGSILETSETLNQLYELYNMANTIYNVIQDPVGAALGFVGDQIASGIGSITGLSDSAGSLGSSFFGGSGGGGYSCVGSCG